MKPITLFIFGLMLLIAGIGIGCAAMWKFVIKHITNMPPRRKDIKTQVANAKYGIAYVDSTDKNMQLLNIPPKRNSEGVAYQSIIATRRVVIEEVLSQEFEVELNSNEDAYQQVREMYKNKKLPMTIPRKVQVNAMIYDENNCETDWSDLHLI